jgi:prolyl-tRNA synthetase
MADKAQQTAISPTRGADFPEWYQQVIKAAELAENSPVRGCMVIRPWGWGIWERLQSDMDRKIKALGHENVYFPLFIPLSYLEKEAAHVEGFAKECAVVTHHRLELKDGKLIPTGELDEPLIVRPTSETIIGESFARWIKSYRDLPLLINQWANVVRWEMRPRLFLRTAEFLWQEGHTAHANAVEAREEVHTILKMYKEFAEKILAMPVIAGEKPPHERFPGADETFSIEAMMQDRKALQAATSHFLGQNFAQAAGIKFLNKEGTLEHAYTTSWGASTRLIGGLVMTHGDDDGLRVPPRVAPKHVVILPITPKPETEQAVQEYAKKIAESLRELNYHGSPLVVHIDSRDIRGGEKSWQWIKRGVPIRVEVGPRDIETNSVVMFRRDRSRTDKAILSINDLKDKVVGVLDEIQESYYQDALRYREENTERSITNYEDFVRYFTPKNKNKPEIHGGFLIGKWSGDPESLKLLADLKVTIRCIPLEQSGTEGTCVLTGKPARTEAIFAKAY